MSMGKNVAWTDQAKAQLHAIDQPSALRILHTLARYLETGEGDVKRLQNIEPPEFRLRVGDYRVRFHEHENVIRITAAAEHSSPIFGSHFPHSWKPESSGEGYGSSPRANIITQVCRQLGATLVSY
jgi:mRNA-degrading endonuclease RelE of RelBE toxin-antitoxin system